MQQILFFFWSQWTIFVAWLTEYVSLIFFKLKKEGFFFVPVIMSSDYVSLVISIVGNGKCSKSSLAKSMVGESFTEEYTPTISSVEHFTQFTVNGSPVPSQVQGLHPFLQVTSFVVVMLCRLFWAAVYCWRKLMAGHCLQCDIGLFWCCGRKWSC